MTIKQFLMPLIVLALLAGSSQDTLADKTKVTRKILLPDGKPAASIPILIRAFHLQESRLKTETKAETDAEGVFAAEVDIDPPEAARHLTPSRYYFPGYVIVDVPDAALALIGLNLWRDPNGRWREPLRLETGYILAGQVTAKGKPIADASIALTMLNGWWVNNPSSGIITPQLTTKTGANGFYETRPVMLEGNSTFDRSRFIRGSAMASAIVEGQLLSGSAADQVLVEAGAPPVPPRARGDIILGGTWTVRGKVVNALNGQPVAGATVTVAARNVVPLAPVVTNARGEWEVTGIPPVFEVFATATHPKLSIGWTQISERLSRIDDQAREPKTFSDVLIKLRPMTTITGRVVEEETGQMPPPVLPSWNLSRTVGSLYERGILYGNQMLGQGRVHAPIQPDGQFSLSVPVGENSISVGVPLYKSEEREVTLNVAPEGQKDILLKIHKQPYFYVRLEAERPEDLNELSVSMRSDKFPADKYPDGVWAGQYKGGYWRNQAEKWGETVEIWVRRGSGRNFKEVMPWTKVTADPKDATLFFNPMIFVQGLYPALDPLISTSQHLNPAVVGDEHYTTAQRARQTIQRAKELLTDPVFLEYVAHRANRRAHQRFEEFMAARLQELPEPDRLLIARARKLQRFLTQPFFVAEPFTGLTGKWVGREETLRGCNEILDGRYNGLPEHAFAMIGVADEAREQTRKLG